MADYRKEFPDFPEADLPAIPATFVDTSWHNAACPSFTSDQAGLTIWVDYLDIAKREHPVTPRFSVTPQDHGVEVSGETLESDDWNEVLAFVAKKAAAGRKAFFERPLRDIATAKIWIAELVSRGLDFHFEDDPSEIVTTGQPGTTFAEAEWPEIRRRVAELYALNWTKADGGCPIGYMLKVSGHDVE